MTLSRPLVASDGLPARDSGPWAREKLSFLDDYVPPALLATERKRHRYYIDLFAGPGRNIERGTGAEFEGSPIKALRMSAPGRGNLSFTHAIFVNRDGTDHRALETRVRRLVEAGESRIALPRIRLVNGDANEWLRGLLRDVPTRAYVLVLADIEKPKDWPFDSVRGLHRWGHESIHFCMLLPLEMALARLLGYSRDHTEKHARVLTRFFGSEDWRALAEARITDSQSPALRQAMVDLYLGQLRRVGWGHAQSVKNVRYSGRRLLYRMLFASNHPAGNRLARWAHRHGEKGDQFDFPF